MKPAVLLLAHGAPERIEDVERYLGFVRGGEAVSPCVLEEVTKRYVAIGGCSPLTHWTRVQAEALEKLAGIPVFFGMRNWRPFVKETMEQVRARGVTYGTSNHSSVAEAGRSMTRRSARKRLRR